MTWQDAVKQMVKAYWETDELDETETFKKAKYNKKYFNAMEEEFHPAKTKEKDKKRK